MKAMILKISADSVKRLAQLKLNILISIQFFQAILEDLNATRLGGEKQ